MPNTPFIGQIMPWAPNFAPRGWAFCEGQLLAIAQNDALFSILGTIYGGDGRTTFGLPDLRGRVPVHPGAGAGLQTIRLGQVIGLEDVTINELTLPQHSHAATTSVSVRATTDDGDQTDPSATHRLAAGKFAANGADVKRYRAAPADTPLGGLSVTTNVGSVGGSRSHTNIQPTLAARYVIALVGVFPSRQ